MSDMDMYLTVAEMASRFKMTEKFVRQYFIKGGRVRFLQFGRKYLIESKSAKEWEELRLKGVEKKRVQSRF